jgi:hypothetical protein
LAAFFKFSPAFLRELEGAQPAEEFFSSLLGACVADLDTVRWYDHTSGAKRTE